MLSFWEKQIQKRYDFIVVGAGIMGCSIAAELREKHTHATIAVLERGVFPTGASTKNAGFACFGSVTEIQSDIQRMGLQPALQLIEDRWRGLSIISSRFTDIQMGKTAHGGFELLFDNTVTEDSIAELNKQLFPIFRETVFASNSDKIEAFGFSNQVRQLIMCKQEAQIDSGKLLMNYWNYLKEKDVDLITGASVKHIEENTLELKDGSIWTAQHNYLCTNAFTEGIPLTQPIKPGRGQVVLTNELPNLKFKGSFHFDEGYYYFRNVGKRVLFGGGRNLDFETEATCSFESNPKILQDLKQKLQETILYQTPFEIEQHWQGIMAFSEDKKPSRQAINPYCTYVMACNGMGVALSPWMARKVVRLE